ncbi:saccharopine dehydrogenase NADP-binding domain-containing protein [Nocardiopsis valliformis]|uniref:saccharopine dehydrogenase NADP-binding domain-containing protein n=1 Tax=Nocardiopsis valliformis TaxID=239974 RepID=UPI000348085F|nr:saccharopine dehydrogenase NADP-binding domain-containing protein [Nocardiopsis valliformis]
MTGPGTVAVLGATGIVGRAALDLLRRLGVTDLRAGARDPERLRLVAAETGARAVPADADDPASLAAFCEGARLVLNCAGPSYLLLDRVARAALGAGADYVDVSGDGPAHRLLGGTDLLEGGRVAVLSAGMLPGLANLVPAHLGGDDLSGARLRVYAGGIERFSPAAAGDLVLSVDGADGTGGDHWYGEALAAWRGGRRVPRALSAEEDTEVPYFPGRVTVMPYLTADCERLARSAGLASLEWFNVFTGPQLRPALGRLRGHVSRDPAALAAAVEQVRAAGELDLGHNNPYYLMAFTLTTPEVTRTAVLRTPSSFRLTAATAVLAARSVLDGAVPPGLHFADEVLDPGPTLHGARRLGTLPLLDVHDHDGGDHALPIEEGSL